MEKSPAQGGIASRLHALYDRHAKLVERLANILGVATGAAWLVGLMPASPDWIWPVVATLAAITAALTLYRSFELSQRLDLQRKAFDELYRVALAQHIEALRSVFADFEISGKIPVAHLAAYIATLRQYSRSPESLDELLDLLHEYERIRQ